MWMIRPPAFMWRTAFLGRHEDAGDVHRDHPLVILEGDLLDGAAEADPGIVDQDVDAAERVDGPGDAGADRVGVAGVGLDRDRLATGRLDRTDDPVRLLG